MSGEGTISFPVAGLAESCETWYKVVGDLTVPEVIPLVILHGGPGACHEYLLPLQCLASPSRPLIFYDQIGNGKSTHLPQFKGDESFWTVDLFLSELSNLLSHFGLDSRTFDIHGQSWGGMLGAEYAIRGEHRQNLRRLVISNSLASNALFMEGSAIELQTFPANVQTTIQEAKDAMNFETKECNAALDFYMRRLMSVAEPWPVPELVVALEWLAKDDTTHSTIYGPSIFSPTGALRNWSIVDELHKINAKTLVITGELEGAQRIAARPFLDGIRRVKSADIPGAAHMSHLDQPEIYYDVVSKFLDTPEEEYK